MVEIVCITILQGFPNNNESIILKLNYYLISAPQHQEQGHCRGWDSTLARISAWKEGGTALEGRDFLIMENSIVKYNGFKRDVARWGLYHHSSIPNNVYNMSNV